MSDDYLYFEGYARPASLFTLHDKSKDEKISKKEDIVILDKYFNDLYNLFLRKLTTFAGNNPTSDEESVKLQALLQELIKVRNLIENSTKTAIMTE